tara:strand:- start:19438 stop:19614 length:177 start_codon:yes stop_codon:yes gene_type:complete
MFHFKSRIMFNPTKTHQTLSDVQKTSTKKLLNYLKQGIADIETEDIIHKEIYEIRENY